MRHPEPNQRPQRFNIGRNLTERYPLPRGTRYLQCELTKGDDVRVHVRVSLWDADRALIEHYAVRMGAAIWRMVYLPGTIMFAKAAGLTFQLRREAANLHREPQRPDKDQT